MYSRFPSSIPVGPVHLRHGDRPPAVTAERLWPSPSPHIILFFLFFGRKNNPLDRITKAWSHQTTNQGPPSSSLVEKNYHLQPKTHFVNVSSFLLIIMIITWSHFLFYHLLISWFYPIILSYSAAAIPNIKLSHAVAQLMSDVPTAV